MSILAISMYCIVIEIHIRDSHMHFKLSFHYWVHYIKLHFEDKETVA